MSRRLIATAAAILACAIPVAASAALTKVGTPAVTIAAVLKGPGDTKVGDFKGTSSSLNVADDGSVMLGSTATTADEMARRLQIERARLGDDMEVRIRAARTVPYSAVEPILLACADSGIWNVTFAVHRKEGGARSED